MSEQNVEVIKRGWDAYKCGGIQAAYPFYSEDCEIVDPPELPDPVTGRGREGLQAILNRFSEMWEGFSLAPLEFIDAGGDKVIAVCEMKGSGRESGIPLPDTPLVLLYHLEGGLVVRQRAFFSRERALEAAGVSV